MKLRLASYNVHGFVGTDGRRDLSRTAAVLRGLNADVIALQEVSFDQPLDLLPGYASIDAPIQRRDGVRHGNLVLSRLPIARSRRISLDYEAFEPRTAVEVWLDTGARPLRVVATHLGLRPVERRFQVKQILEHVAGDETSVTVLLGDFNEWFLAGRPLRWLHRRFGRGAAVRTFPSRYPLLALDRIWVHPRSALQSFASQTSAETRLASDHLPVIAELSF